MGAGERGREKGDEGLLGSGEGGHSLAELGLGSVAALHVPYRLANHSHSRATQTCDLGWRQRKRSPRGVGKQEERETGEVRKRSSAGGVLGRSAPPKHPGSLLARAPVELHGDGWYAIELGEEAREGGCAKP